MRPTLDLVTTAYHQALRRRAHAAANPQAESARLEAHLASKKEGKAVVARGPFTFQWVRRERVVAVEPPPPPPPPLSSASSFLSSSSSRKAPAVVNGERLRRNFITMIDADEALAFYVRWYALQMAAPLQEKTTLLECGTHDGTWRKWVLDIDASMEELQAHSYATDAGELLAAVLQLGQAFGDALHELGYLHAPSACPFAVVSRHSETKRSWHITLCALARLADWREAVHAITEAGFDVDRPGWDMLRFLDPAIARNSCGQYMQVLGSTKVSPGKPADGNCFVSEGLWASATESIPIAEEVRLPLFYAATSLVMHDPWSVPFAHLLPSSSAGAPPPKAKKRQHHHHHHRHCRI
jgi:hypothetical protein